MTARARACIDTLQVSTRLDLAAWLVHQCGGHLDGQLTCLLKRGLDDPARFRIIQLRDLRQATSP